MNNRRRKRIKTEDRIMKSKAQWTLQEDQKMLQIIKECGRKSWMMIAEKLKEEIPGFDKNEQQCMNRFRNHLKSIVNSAALPKAQGFLMLVLHRFYKNNWAQIKQIMKTVSEEMLENYFFQSIEITIRNIRDNSFPLSVLNKPTNMYETVYILDLLQKEYFPSISQIQEENKRPKEQELIDNLKKTRITEKILQNYREILYKKFKEQYRSQELPIVISIDLDKAGVTENEARDLCGSEVDYNSKELNDALIIRFLSDNKEISKALGKEEQKKEEAKGKTSPNFSFPVYRSMLPIFVQKKPVASDMSFVYAQPVYSSIPITTQIPGPLATSFTQQRQQPNMIQRIVPQINQNVNPLPRQDNPVEAAGLNKENK